MNGIGLFLWPDKKKYLGQYFNDNKSGLGIFIWPDGREYKGEWEKGKQHGRGIFIFSGISQFGEWIEGKRTKWIEDNSDEINLLIKKFNNEFYAKIPVIISGILNLNLKINEKLKNYLISEEVDNRLYKLNYESESINGILCNIKEENRIDDNQYNSFVREL